MIFRKLCLLITFFSISFSHAEVSEKKILILGDSLTEGYGVSKNDAYPTLLENHLKKKNSKIKVINAGSSGSTSASAFSRLRWHIKAKPHILILALGGNDGLRGIQPNATKENLKKAIKMAKENGIIVYLAGMQMPYNYGKEYQDSFAKVFKDLVKEFKLKEIPFLLKGVGGIKELNQADGIHPNEKGHRIIAKTVATILEKDL